jgi:hypothetical protein
MRPYPASIFVLVLLSASCSIIQDSDIKSAAEVSSLALKSVTIDQTTSSGSSSLAILQTIDKTVAINTAAGPINRYVEMNAPVFPATSKMKFRTAVPTGAKMYIYYFSNGKPSTFGIYKENLVNGAVKDSTFYEVYRFRYDAAGKLTKFTTFLSPCCNAATTNDTLIYSNNKIATITRKSPTNTAKTGTITASYAASASSPVMTNVTFEPLSTLKYTYDNNTCFTCITESYSSTSITFAIKTTGQNGQLVTSTTSNANIVLTSLGNKSQTVSIEDSRGNSNGNNNNVNPDTYYFHPMMLLANDLTNGVALFHMYMIDWWQQGTPQTNGSGSNTNERVNFTFNYGKK